MYRPTLPARHILVRLLCALAVAALLLLTETHWGFGWAPQLIGPGADEPSSSAGALAAADPGAAEREDIDATSALDLKLAPTEAHLFKLLNDERAAHNLATLQLDARLVELARARSNDMVARNYFSHVTPEGTMVFSMMDREKIPYRLAGENLARNAYPPDKSPEVAHQGFMDSPKHRENELEPTFTRVGVGAALSSNGTFYFTELFTAW